MADSQVNFTTLVAGADTETAFDTKLLGGKQTPQHGIRDGMHEAFGAMADAAATTDTGTFSLIALFKRFLGRVPTLGQKVTTGSSPVVIASDQSAIPVRGGPVTVTDSSSTIAAGGTAQTPIAANAARRYLHIGNPDSSRVLFFNTTGVAAVGAAGSMPLGPGAAYIWDMTVPAGAVSVIGAATGQPFTAKEG